MEPMAPVNGDVMARIAIKKKECHWRQWRRWCQLLHWHQLRQWLGYGHGSRLGLAPLLPLAPMASFEIHWHCYNCRQWCHLCQWITIVRLSLYSVLSLNGPKTGPLGQLSLLDLVRTPMNLALDFEVHLDSLLKLIWTHYESKNSVGER